MNQSRAATCQWSPRTVQETNQNRSLFHHFYHRFLQKNETHHFKNPLITSVNCEEDHQWLHTLRISNQIQY